MTGMFFRRSEAWVGLFLEFEVEVSSKFKWKNLPGCLVVFERRGGYELECFVPFFPLSLWERAGVRV
jgi:hypothetical protein